MIAGLNLAMYLVGYALSVGVSGRLDFDVTSVNAIVYSLLAALIISRYPRHALGWLFLVVGFFFALQTLNGGLGVVAPTIGSERVLGLTAWVDHVIWIPANMIPISLGLQFFPDGRLPSRRWWPFPAFALLGMLGYVASFGFHPWPMEAYGILESYNPFAIAAIERLFSPLFYGSVLAFGIGGLGALLTLVVRFLRSESIVRTQMKWLMYVSVLGFSAMLLTLAVYRELDNPANTYIFPLLPTLLATAIALAILRYRLFDIDIIIRRTLQYSIVTGILALVYYGLVVVLQALFAAVGDVQSEVFVVISTLVIAALFNPLRNRVQAVIDRRFYRRKYDTERALAGFAAVARDEVDLDRLTVAMLGVVAETIQPEFVSFSPISRERWAGESG